jgi:hypothetical protein
MLALRERLAEQTPQHRISVEVEAVVEGQPRVRCQVLAIATHQSIMDFAADFVQIYVLNIVRQVVQPS